MRAAHATEAIAAEIYRQCECSGQPVTMSVINRALNQLRSHRPACKCGLCEAAAKVKADRVPGAAIQQGASYPRYPIYAPRMPESENSSSKVAVFFRYGHWLADGRHP